MAGDTEKVSCISTSCQLVRITDAYHKVVPDGYGLSYSIGNNYIRWTITSLKRNTAELKHYLSEAATETREMMERAKNAEMGQEVVKTKL
jgi:carnitine O-acetyltransferase